jgi:hypothetical protein
VLYKLNPSNYDNLVNFFINNLINSMDKPLTFKPDLSMGEGVPTPEEVQYRQDLLKLAKDLYKKIEGTINQNLPVNDKIRKIDAYINDFILEGQKVVLQHIPRTWNNAEKEGMRKLESLAPEKDFQEKKINTSPKDLIIQQQQMNIEDIGLKLRGRIRQYLNIKAIKTEDKTPSHLTNTLTNAVPTSKWTRCMIDLSQTDPSLTEQELREACEEREWESYFGDVENSTDKLGLFGWITANQLGLLAALTMGTVIIGDLVADWVSQGDDRVCDECLELEANSPYSVLAWPESPHFGCRCELQNIRLITESASYYGANEN